MEWMFPYFSNKLGKSSILMIMDTDLLFYFRIYILLLWTALLFQLACPNISVVKCKRMDSLGQSYGGFKFLYIVTVALQRSQCQLHFLCLPLRINCQSYSSSLDIIDLPIVSTLLHCVEWPCNVILVSNNAPGGHKPRQWCGTVTLPVNIKQCGLWHVLFSVSELSLCWGNYFP